ncbi:nutritionally-regulated adipose and cardiac enriched protein homolog [Heterodontus francisci]|uniref:nutritionally-regulated adipose and cardiac enriched protein homolog n=1 Tax=Heterodontus francisci TaxID=7792 RepID=UPI00355BF4A1
MALKLVTGSLENQLMEMVIPEEETDRSGDDIFPEKSMLNNKREQLYTKGVQYLQQGNCCSNLQRSMTIDDQKAELVEAVTVDVICSVIKQQRQYSDHNTSMEITLQKFISKMKTVFFYYDAEHNLQPNTAHGVTSLQLPVRPAEKMYYETALINLTAMMEELATDEGESWNSSEKSSIQAQLARDYKKLTKLCIMSNRSHLALECSGEKVFVSENPVTTRNFEFLTSECKVIDEADLLRPHNSAISQNSTADQLPELSNKVLPETLENTPDSKMMKTNRLSTNICHTQEVITLKYPRSILRKRSDMTRNEEGYVSHRRRTERRVRFREMDEIIFHTYGCNSPLPAMFWKLLIIILLSLVIILVCCSKSASNIFEQLQSKLYSYYLEVKHMTFSWLTWSRKN